MDIRVAKLKAAIQIEKLKDKDRERERCENSLLAFARYVWPVVEPAIEFIEGWAIEAIAEHLEAVTDGHIRRLLINVPPGFTKPVRKDTIIQTLRGRIPISDAVIGDFVLTHKGRFRRIEGVHHQGVLPILRVATWCGREVFAGLDHPFLTTRGWIEARKLTVNDVLAAVAQKDDYGTRISVYEARFLGYMVGDGSTKYGSITFTNMESDILGDFRNCCKALDFVTNDSIRPGNKALTLKISSNRNGKLQTFLKRHNLAGKDSYTKRIPEAVMNGDELTRSNFLGAYWSCDGYVAIRHKGRKTSYLAKLTTVGEKLAKDIQCLALSLGINLRIRKRVAKLQSKRQGSQYVSYDLEATNQDEVAKIKGLFGLCDRKYEAIRGAVRRTFNKCLLPDPIESISQSEPAECMCLTVEEDNSFVANGLAVHNSLMTDVFWPSWEWGPCNMPTLRYMCAAYSNHLTERDNMRCRNIVISDRYKRLWGDRFKISNEQFTKIKFANDKTGWKLATSVAGIGTGERADRVIIDDPNNPMEMESEAVRYTTNMWFTEVIPDRLNSQSDSAIVVIQQRTHEDDVSGTAISREMGYTHLMIPMYHDVARHCVTTYGPKKWEDPRKEDGELAWPERFPEEICKELERDKGNYAFAGQYLQSPEPRGGSIIKRDWWQIWEEDKFPDFDFILGVLDTAYTSKQENDPSAMVILGVFRERLTIDVGSEALWMPRDGQTARQSEGNPKVMLMYAWQDRLEFYDLIQRVIDTCVITPSPKPHPRYPIDRLIIEGKATGLSVHQELYRMLGAAGKFGIETIDNAKGRWTPDKVARLHSVQHLFANKMVYAPDREWADMVINQVSVFPRGSHDDLVDCISMGMRYLRDTGFALRSEESELVRKEELLYTSPSSNGPLYNI